MRTRAFRLVLGLLFAAAWAVELAAAEPAGKPTLALVGGRIIEKEIGTLAPGRYADVIAVRGDVLTSIDLLGRVDIVVKNGKRIR